MTVSSTGSAFRFIGNGATTAFSFPRPFFDDTDLKVYLVDIATNVATLQSLGVHYTVAGAGVPAGGTVTMVTAPATGKALVVYRDTPLTQDLDLSNVTSFPMDSVEASFDRAMMAIDDLEEKAVVANPAHYSAFDTTLPAPVASGILGVKSDGTGFEYLSSDDLPAGPAGPTGPQGPAGPTGPQGAASTVPGPSGLDGGSLNALEFFTLASLIANTSLTYTLSQPGTVNVGSYIKVRDIDCYFTVAASGASDHHRVTAGGVKLYVVRGVRGYNIKAFGVTGDGTTNDGPAITTAVGLVNDFFLPAGTYKITSQQNITIVANKTFNGNGDVQIFTSGGGLTFMVGTKYLKDNQTIIAAQNAHYIDFPTQYDAEGDTFVAGDMLYLEGSAAAESYWGYKSRTTRRIVNVSGTRVWLDQPLDFFYDNTDTTDVRTYPVLGVKFNGINFKADTTPGNTGGNNLRFYRLSNCEFRNGTLEGSTRGWTDTGWSDVFNLDICDGVLVENVVLRNGRYLPLITGGRRVTVRNFIAESLRHIDINSFSSDCLIENGVGRDNDTILESHCALRSIHRNVHDSTSNSTIRGIAVRSYGSIIEDCSSSNIDGIIGTDTQDTNPVAKYAAWAQTFPRVWRRFRSRTACIGLNGPTGPVIVEDCVVPDIFGGGASDVVSVMLKNNTLTSPSTSNINTPASGRLKGDNGIIPVAWKPGWARGTNPVTQVTGISNAAVGVVTTGAAHGLADNDVVKIPNIRGLWPATAGYTPVAITGATRANPVVITAPAHGITTPCTIYITGMAGMTELNGKTFIARNGTANTLELYTDAWTSVTVDGTAYGTYTSGGTVSSRDSTQKRDSYDNLYTVKNSTATTFELWTIDAVPVAVDTSALTPFIAGGYYGANVYVYKVKATKAFNPSWDKDVGLWPERRYRILNLLKESATTGSATRTFTLQLYTDMGQTSSGTFWARLKFMLRHDQGSSETHYETCIMRYSTNIRYGRRVDRLSYDVNMGMLTIAPTSTLLDGGTGGIIFANSPDAHFGSAEVAEGTNSSYLYPADYYWSIDVTITLPSTARYVQNLDVEVMEWQSNNDAY